MSTRTGASMNKRTTYFFDELPKITVSAPELAEMLSVGRATADKIGTAAGAVVRIGRLKRFNVDKVKIYLSTLETAQNEPEQAEKLHAV